MYEKVNYNKKGFLYYYKLNQKQIENKHLKTKIKSNQSINQNRARLLRFIFFGFSSGTLGIFCVQ